MDGGHGMHPLVKYVARYIEDHGDGEMRIGSILSHDRERTIEIRKVFGGMKQMITQNPDVFATRRDPSNRNEVIAIVRRHGGSDERQQSRGSPSSSSSSSSSSSWAPIVAPGPRPWRPSVSLVDPPSQSVYLIDNIALSVHACRSLLETEAIYMVSVALEGSDIGAPNGRISTLQLGTWRATYVFDVASHPQMFEKGRGLKELLESPQVVKLMHDCGPKVRALKDVRVEVASVFDTQVALQLVEKDIKSPTFGQLLKSTSGRKAPPKEDSVAGQRSVWFSRPLSNELIEVAAANCNLLYECAVILMSRTTENSVSKIISLCKKRVREALQNVAIKKEDLSVTLRRFAAFVEAPFDEDVDDAAIRRYPSVFVVRIEMDKFVAALPKSVATALDQNFPNAASDLIDVQMDLGRHVVFTRMGKRPVRCRDYIVSREDINHVLEGRQLRNANRFCIGDSLHRCTVIHDPYTNEPVGLTIRLARHVSGLANVISDVLSRQKNVLVLGKPSSGRTTLLRNVAEALASFDHDRRVVVVDTWCDIAGDDSVPRDSIGDARRIMVKDRAEQHRHIADAVLSHSPESLVIDEIGTPQDIQEAISATRRGVQVVTSTHACSIEDAVKDPSLQTLLSSGAFDVCIELTSVNSWRIHHNIDKAVQALLKKDEEQKCEIRELDFDHHESSSSYQPFPVKEQDEDDQ